LYIFVGFGLPVAAWIFSRIFKEAGDIYMNIHVHTGASVCSAFERMDFDFFTSHISPFGVTMETGTRHSTL